VRGLCGKHRKMRNHTQKLLMRRRRAAGLTTD
jgi:hypothetical protein